MNDAPDEHRRWRLLRDVAVFQAKLLVDGIRDLLLSPISVAAVLAGLLAHRNDPDRYFRRLIKLGARSERWINLFEHQRTPEEPGIDEIFRRLELRVIEQYERGGLTAQAKQALDRSLDHVHKRVESLSHERPPPSPTAGDVQKVQSVDEQMGQAPLAEHPQTGEKTRIG